MFYDVYTKLCNEKGISRSRAAADMGLSNSTVTKWKKTGATPNGDTLFKIASYFGVSVGYLLSHKPEEEAADPLKDELIAFYGDVKKDLTEDDIDDLMVAMRAKAERNKRKKSGD